MDKLLSASGAKSWSSFVRGTISATVEMDEYIVFTPSINEGPKQGFSALDSKATRIARDVYPEQCGQCVLNALNLSQRVG
jgi:hypothetical protein